MDETGGVTQALLFVVGAPLVCGVGTLDEHGHDSLFLALGRLLRRGVLSFAHCWLPCTGGFDSMWRSISARALSPQ